MAMSSGQSLYNEHNSAFFFPEAQEKPKKAKILILAWFSETTAAMVRESVFNIQKHSQFNIDICNTYQFWKEFNPAVGAHSIRAEKFRQKVHSYDAIFYHCSTSYSLEMLYKIDSDFSLNQYSGSIILMKQDEMRHVNIFKEYIQKREVKLLITCLSAGEARRIYPPQDFPKLKFLHSLTGYVTREMREFIAPDQAHRPIDISYRGSEQPFVFGKMCYEKYWLASAFTSAVKSHKLNLDISAHWKDRVYGHAWWKLLCDSKGVLGTESGVTLFDFTGDLESQCDDYRARNHDCSFMEVWDKILKPYEGNVDYRTISPRHFEAAACGTVQILLEGDYAGIFKPDRHYLPLKRDFSNLKEILAKFEDLSFRQKMVDTAFNEIILNPLWSYEKHIENLDVKLEEIFPRSPESVAKVIGHKKSAKPHLLVVLYWYLSQDSRVLREINVFRDLFDITLLSRDEKPINGLTCWQLTDCWQLTESSFKMTLSVVLHVLRNTIFAAAKIVLPIKLMNVVYKLLGKPLYNRDSVEGNIKLIKSGLLRLRQNAKRMQVWQKQVAPLGVTFPILTQNLSVPHAAMEPIKPYDAVLAIDADVLDPAFTIAKGAPVFADIHELFFDEYSDPVWQKQIRPIRERSGREFLHRCAGIFTVSRGLAELFKRKFNVHADIIFSGPEYCNLQPTETNDNSIRIVHHGIAARERRVENIIAMADYLDKRFSLDLYLVNYQDEVYKEFLLNEAGKRPNVRIMPRVQMHELAYVTNSYDIACLLIYPGSESLKYCMPNKFFESIQARLAIAIGPSPDMVELLERHDLGVVAEDFTPRAMAKALNALTKEDIMRFKRNSNEVASIYCAENNMAKMRDSILEGIRKHKNKGK